MQPRFACLPAVLLAAASLSSIACHAQTAPAAPVVPEGLTTGSDKAVIPALLPVVVRFEAEVSSQTSKTGEHFPITLAEPILLNGAVVVPAGTVGDGEIVHAKKSGGSGAAGELVLAARWVEVNGRRLRLRSLKAATAGKDAIHQVDAINAASVVAPLPIGLLGFAVNGAKAVYPKGTLATAKTAEPFALEPETVSKGPPAPGAPNMEEEKTNGD